MKIKLGVGAVVAALLLWFFWPKKAVGRVKSELEIDADVYSPTFGEPIDRTSPVDTGTDYGPPVPQKSIWSRTFGRQATMDELNAAAAAALDGGT